MRKTEPILALIIVVGVICTIVLIEKPTPRDELEDILFAVHGSRMETADEERAYAILVEHGHFYDNPVRFIEGPEHKCYESSEKYFLENPGSEICIGYTFSRDRWWYHTWVLDRGYIIEFTVERQYYFGMALGVWE